MHRRTHRRSSRWIVRAQATARRALENASIGSVPLRLDDRAPVCRGDVFDHGVVPSEEIEPGVVAEPDVRTVESTMSVKTIVTVPSAASVLERSGCSRWIVRSSSSSVDRQRPMAQRRSTRAATSGSARSSTRRARGGERRSRARRSSHSAAMSVNLRTRPPDGAFLPGLYLVPDHGEAAQLLHLTTPDGAVSASPVSTRRDPCRWSAPRGAPTCARGRTPSRPRSLRSSHRWTIAADLLRRLHAAECLRPVCAAREGRRRRPAPFGRT